jgi:pimeloyl-ACP methyl ester carboxylesterase
MSQAEEITNWSEGHYTSRDGLRLYARRYAAGKDDGARPVLCLPGLTRNAKDFHLLATHLSEASEPTRDVYCVDYRGRGQSDHDRDWGNYTPYNEMLDILDFMTITGLHEACVIGTSRGGIIAMLMAVMRPTAIGVCVLNDIGPVLETGGLARIKGYVGKTPVPANWQEAGGIVKTMNEQFFPYIEDDEWEQIARQMFADAGGRPQSDYDPKLANAMDQIDLSKKVPAMWPQFQALSHAPTLVLHGENSDLLSETTVREMAKRHPRLTTHTVPDQGHPPLLRDMETMELIAGFIAAADSETH